MSLYHFGPKSVLEVNMGHGEQDELTGKSGITSNQRTGGIVSCGPFPIPNVVEMPDISSASRLIIYFL